MSKRGRRDRKDRPRSRSKSEPPVAKTPQYRDVHGLPEDERIRQIGEAAMIGKVVSFVTDSDDGKMERYLFKLLAQFPDLKLLDRGTGPTPGVVWAKVTKS